jgi:hypothetical protein
MGNLLRTRSSEALTKRALKRHALSIALLVSLTGTVAAQGREIVWNLSVQLTQRDKRDIVALAAELGIPTPSRVVDSRSPCPLVSVSSQPVVEGNRVTTTVLGMRPHRGPDCTSASSGANIHRRGNWIAIQFDARDVTPPTVIRADSSRGDFVTATGSAT